MGNYEWFISHVHQCWRSNRRGKQNPHCTESFPAQRSRYSCSSLVWTLLSSCLDTVQEIFTHGGRINQTHAHSLLNVSQLSLLLAQNCQKKNVHLHKQAYTQTHTHTNKTSAEIHTRRMWRAWTLKEENVCWPMVVCLNNCIIQWMRHVKDHLIVSTVLCCVSNKVSSLQPCRPNYLLFSSFSPAMFSTLDWSPQILAVGGGPKKGGKEERERRGRRGKKLIP